mmetsp:Transcript_6467/g.9091  ORF Transcript_6467/g.9091 Transcript_6467/m.9091 type:complete len:171 (+) Transcript_6467:84-596(+)
MWSSPAMVLVGPSSAASARPPVTSDRVKSSSMATGDPCNGFRSTIDRGSSASIVDPFTSMQGRDGMAASMAAGDPSKGFRSMVDGGSAVSWPPGARSILDAFSGHDALDTREWMTLVIITSTAPVHVLARQLLLPATVVRSESMILVEAHHWLKWFDIEALPFVGAKLAS